AKINQASNVQIISTMPELKPTTTLNTSDAPGATGDERQATSGGEQPVARRQSPVAPPSATVEGTIMSIKGQIVEVACLDQQPRFQELMVSPEVDNLRMDVIRFAPFANVFCVAMGNLNGVKRGFRVIGTGKTIEVPVGDNTKGRIMNLLGDP